MLSSTSDEEKGDKNREDRHTKEELDEEEPQGKQDYKEKFLRTPPG